MKFLFILFIPFAALSASFTEAEKLFEQGEFARCDAVIEELLAAQDDLTAQQRKSLNAMREYMLGSDPAQIADTVKRAKNLAGQRNWLTKDLLNHSSMLIRRAGDWKARGIPEYQELSNAAGKLLAQLRDNGDPDLALKILLLNTANHNLNGEYNVPLEEIHRLLGLYYPSRQYERKKYPEGAVRLFILAGEQYSGLGIRGTSNRSKLEALTQAAQFYLRAFENMKADDPQYEELVNRLFYCQETLRLIGYNLKLPAGLKPRRPVAVVMADEMLRTRRFHDAAMVLADAKEPELRLRGATALSAIGEIDRALKIINSPETVITEPRFLLDMARNALAGERKDAAAEFLKLYLKLEPQNPDAYKAARDYANLLLLQESYSEASAELLKIAERSTDPAEKGRLLYSAALCLYKTGNDQACCELLSKLPENSDTLRLAAQSMIRQKRDADAMTRLDKLMTENSSKPSAWRTAANLAIPCALIADRKTAQKYIESFMAKFPSDDASFIYAGNLPALYAENGAGEEKYIKLGKWTLLNGPDNHLTTAMVTTCAEHLKDAGTKEELLRGLLQRENMSTEELNALLTHLPTRGLRLEFLNKYRAPFENTPAGCELYFHIAELESEQGNYENVLEICRKLLVQEEVYRYVAVKQLEAKALVGLKRESEARDAWTQILTGKLPAEEKRKITLELSESYERSEELKQAILTAWTAIPLDASEPDTISRQLLKLIVRCAEKLGLEQDIADAKELLLQD